MTGSSSGKDSIDLRTLHRLQRHKLDIGKPYKLTRIVREKNIQKRRYHSDRKLGGLLRLESKNRILVQWVLKRMELTLPTTISENLGAFLGKTKVVFIFRNISELRSPMLTASLEFSVLS